MGKPCIGVNLYGLGVRGGAQFEEAAPKLAEYGFSVVEPLVILSCDREKALGNPLFPAAIWQQEELVKRSRLLKEQYDMHIVSCHVGGIPGDDFSKKAESLIEILQTTDVRFFVFSRMLHSADACERDADMFARCAEAVAPYGGTICYHNHESEMQRGLFAGKEQAFLDILLSLCPALMLEADLGWIRYAGEDEVAFLHTHKDRLRLLHLKDFKNGFSPERREKDNVAIGEGVLRLSEILAVAREIGLDDRLIIDQDCSSGDLLQDLKRGAALCLSSAGSVPEGL